MTQRDRGWREDSLVPISSERLSAAIAESGESVAGLARRMRMRQNTLQYVVSGKTVRCRRSTREKLARHFHVQISWLAGDREAGPFYDRQLDLAVQQGGNLLPGERREELPPLAILRAARLTEAMLERWNQDLATGVAPRPAAGTLLGEILQHYRGKHRTIWLGTYLERFLFSMSTFVPLVYRISDELGQSDVDFALGGSQDGEFTICLIGALERLLAPYLDGTRTLDYPRCYWALHQLQALDRSFFRSAKRAGLLQGQKAIFKARRA